MVVKHHAFTMIELIFAIVIIGITVVSLPMMMQVNTKSTEESSLQEALFFASTNLNMMMSHMWDEHSLNPDDFGQENEKVVLVQAGNARYRTVARNPIVNLGATILYPEQNDTFRIGHINRRFHEDNTSAFFNVSALGSEVAAVTGTDEVNTTNPISAIGNQGTHAYKRAYGGTPSVGYISDADASPFVFSTTTINAASNIRVLEARVTDTGDGDRELVILRAYVANIGQAKPYHRDYR